jgi:putative transposase
LRPIYHAGSAESAAWYLEAFDKGPWEQKYPAIAQSWRRNREAVIPFFAFPTEVRRIIHSPNAIESLNASERKVVCNNRHFPSDPAATKMIWLALRRTSEERKRPRHDKLPTCNWLSSSVNDSC